MRAELTNSAAVDMYSVASHYVHIETRAERLRRMSNFCADAVAYNGQERGLTLDLLAEVADELAHLASVFETLDPMPITTTEVAATNEAR